MVLGAVAVQREGGGRVYARRAAVLCNGECPLRDGALPCAKGRAEGGVCAACRGDVVGAVFVALAAKATLRGQAADQFA